MNRRIVNQPNPVRLGRYRYSKWRWRIAVCALDIVGAVALRVWRAFRPVPRFAAPRRILLVQLDHLGDAVLTSPLLERLSAAYPQAAIDVLASPSNRAVFEADPRVRRVVIAARNWFAREGGRRALGSAVWELGWSLRKEGYDLGIDVRGDVLSVFVLALAGIPRRLGWAMGGGGFLLTDIADWVPGRHEVESRLALLSGSWESRRPIPARVAVAVTDRDRVMVAQWVDIAWPERTVRPSRARPGAADWMAPPPPAILSGATGQARSLGSIAKGGGRRRPAALGPVRSVGSFARGSPWCGDGGKALAVGPLAGAGRSLPG